LIFIVFQKRIDFPAKLAVSGKRISQPLFASELGAVHHYAAAADLAAANNFAFLLNRNRAADGTNHVRVGGYWTFRLRGSKRNVGRVLRIDSTRRVQCREREK